MEQFFIFLLVLVMLFIWFETDAVVEYALKFKIPLPFVKNFWESKQKGEIESYPDFIAFRFNCFLTRLTSCYYCMNTVLNIACYVVYCGFFNINFNFIVLSSNIIAGWIFYPTLRRLAKDEK